MWGQGRGIRHARQSQLCSLFDCTALPQCHILRVRRRNGSAHASAAVDRADNLAFAFSCAATSHCCEPIHAHNILSHFPNTLSILTVSNGFEHSCKVSGVLDAWECTILQARGWKVVCTRQQETASPNSRDTQRQERHRNGTPHGTLELWDAVTALPLLWAVWS